MSNTELTQQVNNNDDNHNGLKIEEAMDLRSVGAREELEGGGKLCNFNSHA